MDRQSLKKEFQNLEEELREMVKSFEFKES